MGTNRSGRQPRPRRTIRQYAQRKQVVDGSIMLAAYAFQLVGLAAAIVLLVNAADGHVKHWSRTSTQVPFYVFCAGALVFSLVCVVTRKRKIGPSRTYLLLFIGAAIIMFMGAMALAVDIG